MNSPRPALRPAPAAETANPVIEARGVSLTFPTADGPVHALKDVNLTIGQGEFVSFIGPSGCGKTTFLRAIAALESPTSGQLTVNGMTPDAARRARAYGYVFQAPGLYPWRTIAGNVSLPRRSTDIAYRRLAGQGTTYPRSTIGRVPRHKLKDNLWFTSFCTGRSAI